MRREETKSLPDLIDDYKTLVNSEAYRIEMRLFVLDSNFYIFKKNYAELNKLLEISDDAKLVLEVWDHEHRDSLDHALLELTRRLQNFLFSAVWLRDATKDLIAEWYSSSAFLAIYQAKERSFFPGNYLFDFITDFRHYVTHKGWRPSIYSQFSLERNPTMLKHMFLVKKQELFASKFRWGLNARVFLKDSIDSIDLRMIVKEYYAQVSEFHGWLIEKLKDFHKSELEWFASEKERLRKLAPQ